MSESLEGAVQTLFSLLKELGRDLGHFSSIHFLGPSGPVKLFPSCKVKSLYKGLKKKFNTEEFTEGNCTVLSFVHNGVKMLVYFKKKS